jgi:hypothetical protein
VALDTDRPASPRPALAPLPAPSYPEASEVAELWASARPVETDAAAAAYLTGRAIDPGMVDLYQLARALPVDAPAPSWARCRGVSWSRSHRLILPVFDHSGAMRSLRAWRVDGENSDAPKRTAPAGKALAGLALACPVARRMLATGQAPSWASAGALEIIITEGEPDFLTWATQTSDADEAPPAVLGVVSGAWGEALAARIPDGARVLIRTHGDEAGARFSAAIVASLAGRNVALFDRGDRGKAA